jgi:GTP-binding protein YchF
MSLLSRKHTIKENPPAINTEAPARRLDTPGQSGFTIRVNVTLFGYPRTGKTTLFNLLAGARAAVHAFDDGKREPNVRAVPLADPRLDRIAAAYPDKRRVAAAFDLTDLVGISFGEVKTSLCLGHLRKADGLIHVVRAFGGEDVPAARGRIDPAADVLSMEEELLLADLVLVDARLEKLDRDLKKMKDPEGEKERDLLGRLRPALESGRGLRTAGLAPAEEKLIRSFAFLTLKPLLHVVNIDEKDLASVRAPEALFPGLAGPARRTLAVSGRIEADLADLDESERRTFMAEYGLAEMSAPLLARQAVGFLDRVTFYTVGKDEVRAWTVRRDAPAVEAAAAIHSDIARGFVRAEVVPAEELFKHGTLHQAKEAGAVRLEGKDYVVRDGDVIYFRFAA